MKEKRNTYGAVQKNNYSDTLIDSFDKHLEIARGLSRGTRTLYCSYARVFLFSLLKTKKRINFIRAEDIIQFILSYTRSGGPKRAQLMVYSLRSFLRFLKQTHVIKDDLADCVPAAAVWKHSTFPIFLSSQEIQKLLSSCDRTLKMGQRDFAVLMLLVQLGLRAAEVCRLTLDDLDWHKSEIIIRGKGSTITRFPLFQDLGAALVAYLQNGRPGTTDNSFFITTYRPLRGLQPSTIRSILRAALMRAGLNPEKKGTHLLRHSFATQLHQQGATLQEIGMILGHKCISTTAVYVRVDFDKLRMLARPWPRNIKDGGSR